MLDGDGSVGAWVKTVHRCCPLAKPVRLWSSRSSCSNPYSLLFPYLSLPCPPGRPRDGHHTPLIRMAASIYFPQRSNGFAEKHSAGPNGSLPMYSSSSAVQEKWRRHHHSESWFTYTTLPIPGVRTRRLRLLTPNPSRVHHLVVNQIGRKRGAVLGLICFTAIYLVFALHRRYGTEEKQWPTPIPFGDPPTLVYRREDLQRIWEWEVAAGHYPSSQKSTS